MTTDLMLPTGTALESNPTQFKNLAAGYDQRRQAVTSTAAELRGVGTSYGVQHSGPDIEAIAAGIDQIASAYDDRVSGYLDLADAFETTYTILLRLEERSDALDNIRTNLRNAEMYGDVTDIDIAAASDAMDEFDAIRTAERKALTALGEAITSTTFGEDITVDSAAWNEIIERAIANTDEPELKAELQTSWSIIADHADDGTIEGNGIPEETTQNVTEARLNGQTSQEAGLPASFFPAGYDKKVRRLRELAHDDHPNIPLWGNPDDQEKAEASKLREELGFDDDPKVTRIQIVSDTGEMHDADEWKGQQLGDVWEENLGRHAADTRFPPASNLSEEAEHLLANEISEEPGTSVGFFNEIGPRATSDIPSLTSDKTTALFGDALAEASQQRINGGRPALEFTGDQIIEARPPSKGTEPAEILFADGNFETEFLADATETSIELRETRIKYSKLADEFGDPSNILIGRAAENPRAVHQVVEGLEEKNLTHLIVNPPAGYVSGPDDTEPITEFLAVAGGDKNTAVILLQEATKADEFSDPGVAAGFDQIMAQHATIMYEEEYLREHGIYPSQVGDPNAEVGSLERTGLFAGADRRRISQADWEAMGLNESDWNKLQEKTHQHGQGLALVAGNEELIREAIAHDVKTDGTVEHDYSRFGLTTGVLERNYVEAAIDYEAQLDANSEEYNRWVSTGRSTALFASSFVPVGRPVLEASFGVVDIFAGHYDAQGELGLDEDTSREKAELTAKLEEYMENPADEHFEEIARVEAIRAAEARGEPAFDYNGDRVRIISSEEGPQYEVEIDGERQTQAPNFDANERPKSILLGSDVGAAATQAKDRVGDPQTKGISAADPSPDADSDDEQSRKENRTVVDAADIWAPLNEDTIEYQPPPIYTTPGLDEAIHGPTA